MTYAKTLLYFHELLGSQDITDSARKFQKYLEINKDRLLPGSEQKFSALDQELIEMSLMAEQAKEQAAAFLKDNGLSATEFEVSWNERFMCLELKAKINGEPIAEQDEHYLSYEGREIKIRIMGLNSNNDFNADDIKERVAATKQAALDINSNIRTEFKDLDARLAELTNKFDSTDLSVIPDVLKSDAILEQELLVLLAVAIIREDPEKNPEKNSSFNPSKKEIQEQINKIKTQVMKNISKQRRAINIVAYPQEVMEEDPSSQWMLTINSPKGDISSNERNMEVPRVSNPWSFTRVAYRIDGNRIDSKHYAEIYRSSSAAQLSEGPIERGPNSPEQKALEALIVETAREKIIVALNSDTRAREGIGKHFVVQTFYLSLLTPLVAKDTIIESTFINILLKNLPPSIMETLLKGNEAEQLRSLKIALENTKLQHLKFSAQDVNFILEHVSEDKRPYNLLEQLKELEIGHEFFFSNFSVNTFKGVDLGGFAPCVHNNKIYNAEGTKYLDGYLSKFLQSKGIKNQDLTGLLYSAISEKATDPKKEWEQKKLGLNKLLISVDAETRSALNLYIQLGDYFASQDDRTITTAKVLGSSARSLIGNRAEKSTNSKLVESYLAAAIETQLASLINFDTRANCKSGKDRTGLFAIILEAAAGPPEKFRINLCRALLLSDIKELIVQNFFGVRGVQIDPDVMDGLVVYLGKTLDGDPDMFKNIVLEGHLRAVGAMPKRIYGIISNDKYGVLQKYLAENPATVFNTSDRSKSPQSPQSPHNTKLGAQKKSLQPQSGEFVLPPFRATRSAAALLSARQPPPVPARKPPPVPKRQPPPVPTRPASVAKPSPVAKQQSMPVLHPAPKLSKQTSAPIDPSNLSFKEKLNLFNKPKDDPHHPHHTKRN